MHALAPLRRMMSAGGAISPVARMRWLCVFHTWKKNAYTEKLPVNLSPDTVAILLSYRRPQNIDVIVRLLLKTPSIAKVIVSNNNPEYHIWDWISVRDPRLTVLSHVVRQPCRMRYALAARETEYRHFLAVDDDIFLLPSQLEKLCQSLRDDPSRPHGVTGQVYDSWRGMVYHNNNNRTQIVDVINRVYAFTKDHVEGLQQLEREAGFGPAHPDWKYSTYDDLFLSFSRGKPRVVCVGKYLDCPSQSASGVALWVQPHFFRLRLAVLLMLRRMRPSQM